jgi:hypothetical protein
MMPQLGLNIVAVLFGALITCLLVLMVRYEAKTGKSLYWFYPVRRLTREDGSLFQIRVLIGLAIAVACAAMTLWFTFLLIQRLVYL